VAKTATVTLAVSVQGDGLTLSESVVLTNTTGSAPTTTTLQTGNNTVTFPVGVFRVLIVPPANNAVQWAIKGLAGDTGVPLTAGEPLFLSENFTSFVINTNAPITFTFYWV
jgi:hypothetical protein